MPPCHAEHHQQHAELNVSPVGAHCARPTGSDGRGTQLIVAGDPQDVRDFLAEGNRVTSYNNFGRPASPSERSKAGVGDIEPPVVRRGAVKVIAWMALTAFVLYGSWLLPSL